MTQGSIQSLLQQALACHRQGQFDRAEALYADILGQAPDQPQALHLLATLKLQLGQAQASLELTERALAVAGRQPERRRYQRRPGRVGRRCGRCARSSSTR